MLKRKRSAGFWFGLSAIVLWFAAGTIARAQIADHVAGLWHLDGNLLDSSGNNNNGTAVGGATFTNHFKFGDPGMMDAVSFNGSDGYVDVGNLPSLDITDHLTLEAWIKPNNFFKPSGQGDGNIYIISKDTSGGRSYGLGVSDPANGGTVSCGAPGAHAFMIVFTTGGVNIACAEKPLTLGVWHHLAGAYDSTSGIAKIYVDGVLDGTASGSGTINVGTADVQLGARQYPGYRAFFNGTIDEARIWDRALSDNEIMSSAQAGLRADWHFDENSGTLTADSSGYGNTGTLHDALWGPTSPSPSFFSNLTFDGDDYVEADNSTSLNLFANITVDAWIYPTSGGQYYTSIVSKGNVGSYAESYALFLDPNNTIGFLVNSTGTSGGRGLVFGSTPLALNTWTHVAGTYNGSQVCVFVNGSADGCVSHAGPVWQTADPVLIGESYREGSGLNTSFFEGKIDEVHIWARALSQPELAFMAATLTKGELFVPEEISQVFGSVLGSGAVFTSDWHVGDTPVSSNAIVLGFIVPDDSGTTLGMVGTSKNYSTPVAGARLMGSQNGMPSLWTLITAERDNADANTLHLLTPLSPSGTKLGMNVQWSAP